MSRAVRRVAAILRREYLVRVRNKWFLITTLGFPLLFVGLGFLPPMLTGLGGDEEPLEVGVVDRAGLRDVDVPALIQEQDSLIHASTLQLSPGIDRDGLSDSLRVSRYDAFLLLDEGLAEEGEARLLTRSSVGQRRQRALRQAVRRASVRSLLVGAGLAADQAEPVEASFRLGLDVVRVDEEGTSSQQLFGFLALAAIFMLYMMFVIYGQMITRGVLEEKTSDIAEILVSSVRPWELMLGKVLGIGGMGLTQIAIWVAALGVLSLYGMTAVAGTLAEIGVEPGTLTEPLLRMGGAFLLFFVLGYFLYATAFAAVGAILGDEQDVQQLSFFPMLLVMLPFFLAIPAVEAPGAAWVTWTSLFPFFSPILMVVRMTMGVAPAWQVVLSVLLVAATTGGMAWLTGRIYRVGILMTGKRPNLPELVRWVRYG